jgi:hypothetical protein
LARDTKVVLTIVIISVVVSGIDVLAAGHDYQLAEPLFVSSFPNALYYYNIGEAVTENRFSMIITIPSNHFGRNHIVPKAISLRFWFMDADTKENLGDFIIDTQSELSNCTLSLVYEWPHYVGMHKGDWWSPCFLYVEFNDRPDINQVQYGVLWGVVLSNMYGPLFNGTRLFARLDMNITYSRWWFGLSVTGSQQTATYSYDLSSVAPIHIYSLEYPYPHYP